MSYLNIYGLPSKFDTKEVSKCGSDKSIVFKHRLLKAIPYFEVLAVLWISVERPQTILQHRYD